MNEVTQDVSSPSVRKQWKALAPLSDKTFRTIWSASLLSNFGQLVLGVAVAWEMTRLTTSPGMVTLVQTALMLPLMLVAVPAGALADMFDRRKIALIGLSFSSICAATLTALSIAGLAGPWVLLAFCFLIGGGTALYSPAWQASISEQVSSEHLPAAVSLGAVSYNIARSFGPALGGLIVVAAGVKAAFSINALFYLPLITAFFFWKRKHNTPRLPPERLDRAIISGMRYALHASSVRTVMIRAVTFGLVSSATVALTPLVARDLLHGDAGTYGLLLGSSGVGAIVGALLVSDVRERMNPETAVRIAILVVGCMVLIVGNSHNRELTMAALAVAGVFNMLIVSMLSVAVQMSVPRWVAARAIAWYSSALTGGIAFGSWGWGNVTAHYGVSTTICVSAIGLLLLPLIGLLLPLPGVAQSGVDVVEPSEDPDIALAITHRSGPIVIEVDYRVDPEDARIFYDTMRQLQSARLRNGGFDWSLARDLGDTAMWTERFHFPTWQDYLRQRSRFTQADRALQAAADAFNTLPAETRIRRRLERPLGSVRWRSDTPDPRSDTVGIFTP